MKDMNTSKIEMRRFAEKHGEVLHHRPWRKRRDGNAWFFGESDLRHSGDSPAYRVFKFTEEQSRLFDEACEEMLKAGELRYLGFAMGDMGSIYTFA